MQYYLLDLRCSETNFKRIKKKIKIKFYNGVNNMTRFEKIKPMSIDEFTDYFMGYIYTCMEDCPEQSCSCHQCIKSWLEEEVEE